MGFLKNLLDYHPDDDDQEDIDSLREKLKKEQVEKGEYATLANMWKGAFKSQKDKEKSE